ESSRRLGVFDDAGGACAFGNGDLAVDLDGYLHGGGKRLTRRADLRTNGLVENNRDRGVRGDDERLWRWRWGRGLLRRLGSSRIRACGCGRVGSRWRSLLI